jgi:hypothetical protein
MIDVVIGDAELSRSQWGRGGIELRMMLEKKVMGRK